MTKAELIAKLLADSLPPTAKVFYRDEEYDDDIEVNEIRHKDVRSWIGRDKKGKKTYETNPNSIILL